MKFNTDSPNQIRRLIYFFLLQKSWNAMRIFSLAMQISKRAIASQKFSTLHRFLEYMLYVEVICTFGQLLAIEEISA